MKTLSALASYTAATAYGTAKSTTAKEKKEKK
jgi:hypothetical protein